MPATTVPMTLDEWEKQSDICYSYGNTNERYLLLSDGAHWRWEAYGNICLVGWKAAINSTTRQSHRTQEGFASAEDTLRDLIDGTGKHVDFIDLASVRAEHLGTDEIVSFCPDLPLISAQEYADDKAGLFAKLSFDSKDCTDGKYEYDLQPGVSVRFDTDHDSPISWTLIKDDAALFHICGLPTLEDARESFASLWLRDPNRAETVYPES